MGAIYQRECKSLFSSMTGCIYIAINLLFSGLFLTIANLRGSSSQIESGMSMMVFILLLTVPVLTMRTVAEDRRQKTDQLLLSLPLTTTGIILGKYLAVVSVMAIPTAVTCLFPLFLSMFGTVALTASYTAILGLFLFGCTLAAIGLFLSSLTENPTIAAILSLGVNIAIYLISYFTYSIPTTAVASLIGILVLVLLCALILYLLTKSLTAAYVFAAVCAAATLIVYLIQRTLFEGIIGKILNGLNFIERLSPMFSGVFDVRCIVYFLSLSALFVFFGIQAFEKRRWN